MSDLKILPLEHPDQQALVDLLEEALAAAKAGDMRCVVIAYTLRGIEGPVMRWRGTSSPRDVADAAFACDVLKQAILAKNVRIT